MRIKRNCKRLLFALLSLLLFVVTIISGVGVAFATDVYSSVLSDLYADSSFNVALYPEKSDDYSIEVFQIAESMNGELFIYTYQPCQKVYELKATQINMSLTDKMGGIVTDDNQIDDNRTDDNVTTGSGHGGGNFRPKTVSLIDNDKPKLYGLTLLSSWGTLCKYKVNDFTVSSETVRYYNITSIYREWLNGIDSKTENDNIFNAKYFRVGKLFKAETVNGSVKYSCKDIDVVEIKEPYVDFLKYYDGLTWGSIFGLEPDKFTDVHYVAFSTDKQIDTLKEADVTYITQTYKEAAFNKGTTYGERSEPQYITLTGKKSVDSTKYSWKCIQRTSDFIKSTGLDKSNAAYDNIKDTEFVLVFLTTPFTQKQKYSLTQGHSYEYNGTNVSNVSVLRLMFETDGVTYNLGALMDQIQGDDIAGNTVKPVTIGFWAYIWQCIVRLFNGTATLTEQIVAVIALFIFVLLLPTLLTVLSLCIPTFGKVMGTIFNGFIAAIKYLFIGLWYIVSAPFRFVAWIVRKCRGE